MFETLIKGDVTQGYKVLILFSYSGPLGILGSGGKQNTTKLVQGCVRNVALSMSSHEHPQ